MKAQLIKLYSHYKSDFQNIIEMTDKAHRVHGPFLMSPTSQYYSQQQKLMIVGQETNGWSSHGDNIELAMQHYVEFNVGADYFASPFWNVTRKLEKAFGTDPFSCAWCNISKFDVNQSTPTGEYLEQISLLDHIIIDEISILQPDNIIFCTGPSLDHRIKGVFDKIKFEPVEGFTHNQLCKLSHLKLPENTWRTYHPNYIRRSKLEPRLISFFEART